MAGGQGPFVPDDMPPVTTRPDSEGSTPYLRTEEVNRCCTQN